MFSIFNHISTWLYIEIFGTIILIFLNLIIPILLIFVTYRTLINFYFSSIALINSLINSLYLFYLIQTVRLRNLSENNCRAIYYLQTSCILVLGYTIVVMHANFILHLFPLSTDKQTYRSFYQSCQVYLRRIFRRLCFGFIMFIWAFSFTSVIPLLYTIDSNEKYPELVFCPGLNQKKTYLDEWFDHNRPMQTIVIHLIPFLINCFLLSIALGKLFYECFDYFYFHLKKQIYRLFRRNFSTNITLQSFHHWFLQYFFRLIFLFSTCLFACIYPIVMRFYSIYFSVFIPLIFVIFNYIFVQKIDTNEQPIIIENENIHLATIPIEQIELQPISNPQRISFTNYLYEKSKH